MEPRNDHPFLGHWQSLVKTLVKQDNPRFYNAILCSQTINNETSPVTNIRYDGSASFPMKELYGSPRNVSLSKSDFNSCAILRKISCAESCDSYCRIFHPNLLCRLPLNKKNSSGYNWTVNLKVSHLGKDPKTPVTKPCPLSFFLLPKRGRLCPRNTVFYRRIL